MKGFIEVTTNVKVLIQISKITDVTGHMISMGKGYFYRVSETYEEIKQLIKNAQ